MKSNLTSAAFRYFVSSVSLTALSFVFFSAALAQTNNQAAIKPKAILIAEWSGHPEALNQVKSLPARPRERPGNTGNETTSAAATALQTKQILAAEESATEDRISQRFALLEPTPLEKQAFELINEQRVLQHLQPLALDLKMLYLAREHSENMARLKFFSHMGRDGKMADDRANEIGLKDWSGIGENIAFSQGYKNSVEIAVQDWTNSQHHKENLLNKKWTRSGIGIAQTPEGKFYITQVFRD